MLIFSCHILCYFEMCINSYFSLYVHFLDGGSFFLSLLKIMSL